MAVYVARSDLQAQACPTLTGLTRLQTPDLGLLLVCTTVPAGLKSGTQFPNNLQNALQEYSVQLYATAYSRRV